MSLKAVSWTLLAALAAAAILLFNHWASYQPLSTLVYSGIVLALAGLANVAVPFRFLGVRKRAAGASILAGGVALTFAALYWPARMMHVAQSRTRLDEIMPEYQFSERHSARIHARPEQVVQAVRQSTFGDMKSLATLLKIRGAVLRTPAQGPGDLRNKRVLDAFTQSGYLFGGSEREIAIFGAWDVRASRRPEVHTVREFADYRAPGTVKMAFDFNVEQAGEGWCTLSTETRVAAHGEVSRGLARYWRFIGSMASRDGPRACPRNDPECPRRAGLPACACGTIRPPPARIPKAQNYRARGH
jgi:hypothetical protein